MFRGKGIHERALSVKDVKFMKKGKILPPTYFFICLLLAIVLHFILPVKKLISTPYNYVGILLIGIGIWLNIWADRLFKNKNTTVKPFEKSSSLIEEGPFVFSRNPMYLGMVIILSGVAVLLGSIMPFIMPVAFFILISVAFIPQEEKALEETFGQSFIEYKKRVRCWL
jgi:protein-S-isoprenylcysteine O-methyltransferase Ste14